MPHVGRILCEECPLFAPKLRARHAPGETKETRRFQRVSRVAGAGFEPATFGL